MEIANAGRARRTERRDEERFRFPAREEIWEVPYSGECEYGEAEAPARKPVESARGKRPELRIAS
jgi:hypothetical protein